jgi:hypothetical protein
VPGAGLNVEFLSRALLEPIDGTDKWQWGADFHFTVDGEHFFIPEGTQTDLDSVPRVPLVYWIAKNRARKSAGVHDFLYGLQRGKEYADQVFAAAMLTEKVRQPYRSMIYAAVRAFGGSSNERREHRQDVPDTPA